VQGRFRKGQGLSSGLPLLRRKRHPLANDGATRIGFGHVMLPSNYGGGTVRIGRTSHRRPLAPGDSALCRLLERRDLAQPRYERATAIMDGALLDHVAALLD
jgi:hypothetical protein